MTAHGRKIAVIGLGYVGLPVAVAFARSGVPVIGFDIDASASPNCAPATTAPARSSRRTSRKPTLRLRQRSGRAQGGRLLHRHGADPDRRRAAGPISAPCSALPRSVGGVLQARRYRRLRIRPSIPARSRRTACRCWSRRLGPEGGQRFHGRLFARAHQSRRQAASLRDHHQGGVGAGCAHARHRRRRLWLGGDGRHPSRALDQGRRGRQGDREHPARSQHRLHERAVADLPPARHRHRRRAGGGRRPNGIS